MTTKAINLHAEHLAPDAIGLGIARPRLSWSFTEQEYEWYQQSYELECEYDDGTVKSVAVHSRENILVPWPFDSLCSRQRVKVRVRVSQTTDTRNSLWSDALFIEIGLLKRDDWKCSLIESSFPTLLPDDTTHRPVIFSRSFQIRQKINSARLYITAHGIYSAALNGTRVGDEVLAPGWTSYTHRLLYQTYNVLPLISTSVDDDQQIEVEVAEGWYCGRLGWNGGRRNIYGESLGLIAMLIIEYDDGSTQSIGTDESWRCSLGSRLVAGLYDGETQDLRLTAQLDQPVIVKPILDNLGAPIGPPVRKVTSVEVRQVVRSRTGKILLDFGQNFVGRCRARLNFERGHQVTFRYAEVLENGELGIRPLRGAGATDVVILPGGPITWEPEFTIHGFRYVEVEGWPGEIQPDDITGIVIHTDMIRTGSFECSNALLNRLHENVVWSMRSNFVSIPTDCPQRDERLGWTGDIHVFADTANFLFDTSGMLLSWLKDVKQEMADSDGIVPLTVPHVVHGLNEEAHAIWGDVIVMLPWALHNAFGDVDALKHHFEDMQRWLEAIPRRDNGLWDYKSTWKLGDWLDPLAPPEDPGNAATDPTFVADSFLIYVIERMVSISTSLGRPDDIEHFTQLAKQYRQVFAQEYITPAGRVASDTQTAYVLVLHFNLLSNPQQVRYATKRLEYLIINNSRFRIATGFAGTPYIGHAMSKHGLSNIFYRMLLHRECPSWLYPVSMGATSVWERWDSMLPDGSINPGEMTSFNHYALGSVANWMHVYILGLRPLEPGWKTFAVQPTPGGGLTWARGSYVSGNGTIKVQWRIREGDDSEQGLMFSLWLTVPANSTAVVQLLGSNSTERKGSGRHEWHVPYQADLNWPPKAVYPPSLEGKVDFYVDPILPFPS